MPAWCWCYGISRQASCALMKRYQGERDLVLALKSARVL